MAISTKASKASPQQFSALAEIERLTAKIAELRTVQLSELRARRKEVRAELDSLDKEIASLTGTSAPSDSTVSQRRPYRPRVNEEELKGAILKALATHGKAGLSTSEMTQHTDYDAAQIRKFLAANPKILKRQGAARSTRYFLR